MSKIDSIKYMKQVEDNVKKLLKSNVTGYEIHQNTGINRSTVSRLRRGITHIKTTNWGTICQLNEYALKVFEEDDDDK